MMPNIQSYDNSEFILKHDPPTEKLSQMTV